MFLILKLILLVLVSLNTILLIRTAQLAWTKDQTDFARGTVTNLPNGLYAGSVEGTPVSWKGKKFDAVTHTGINLFSSSTGTSTEKYPFVFSVGKGTHDPIQVIRIDYNLPANPFWLRPILDEIVEVAPGEYLGKLQLRMFPGYSNTLTFFHLKAAS